MKEEIKNILNANHIYYGCIDEVCEEEEGLIDTFKVCFSYHNSDITIPFNLLEELNEIAKKHKFSMELLQRGIEEGYKPLFMYLIFRSLEGQD